MNSTLPHDTITFSCPTCGAVLTPPMYGCPCRAACAPYVPVTLESVIAAHVAEVAHYQKALAERDVECARLRTLVGEACDLYVHKEPTSPGYGATGIRASQDARIVAIRKAAGL